MWYLFLFIAVSACEGYTFADFETTLASKYDGYESVWSAAHVDCEVDSYTTQDPFLKRFLGISEEYPYVLLKVKDNLTNFDTFVWEADTWAETTASGDWTPQEQINTLRAMNVTPKVWDQPSGVHAGLNLTYAPSALNTSDVNVILYFVDAQAALPLARLLKSQQPEFPSIHFYCWDLMISDAPRVLEYAPSIAVHNYAVHQDEIIEIQQPFDLETLGHFLQANLDMVDFYNKVRTIREANN